MGILSLIIQVLAYSQGCSKSKAAADETLREVWLCKRPEVMWYELSALAVCEG